ncbi:MAG: hypothetical protein J1E06_09325 [Acutalibacter sp.]|nr:hypothetical protein [Acutalibacter sp.]
MRNISGGRTQRIEGFRGIEIQNAPEIIIGKILAWITAAAGKQHICDTVLQSGTEQGFHIEIIQLLQKTALCITVEFRQVVGHIVLHSVICR